MNSQNPTERRRLTLTVSPTTSIETRRGNRPSNSSNLSSSVVSRNPFSSNPPNQLKLKGRTQLTSHLISCFSFHFYCAHHLLPKTWSSSSITKSSNLTPFVFSTSARPYPHRLLYEKAFFLSLFHSLLAKCGEILGLLRIPSTKSDPSARTMFPRPVSRSRYEVAKIRIRICNLLWNWIHHDCFVLFLILIGTGFAVLSEFVLVLVGIGIAIHVGISCWCRDAKWISNRQINASIQFAN